jgi:ubiquinone/menaquinone biosynthesis C-methylase UbiE
MTGHDRKFRKGLMEALRIMVKRLLPERIPGFAADLYEKIAGQAVKEFYRPAAVRVVSLVGTGSILDIGTGPGFLPIEIARLDPDVTVTGIDLTPEMVAKARNNSRRAGLDRRLRFEIGDANNLGFPDETFDGVVSTGSFHAWKNPVRVLRECYRVLKPRGRVWICDPARIGGQGAGEKRRLKGWNRLAMKWGAWTGRVQVHSAEAVRNFLDRTEFSEKEFHYEHGSVVVTLRK